MEEMQRLFRDQLDEVKRTLNPRAGSPAPKYDLSKLAALPQRARAAIAGRNPTRVETLYEHLQQELAEVNASLGADEYPVVLFATGHGEPIQVGTIGYRNPDLIVCEGLDANNQRTRVLAQAGAVQLVVKVVKVDPATPKPTESFSFRGDKAQPGM